MSDDPEALANAQEKSEELLKKVCVDLVEGVREYREDFEPDADDLDREVSGHRGARDARRS